MCVLALLPVKPVIAEEINDSGLTCAQILKLGSEAFVEKYAPGGRGGSVKVRKGYFIYTDCRTKENQRLISKLPASMRAPMKTISEQLRIAALASVEMREALAGGGTMYLDFRAAAVAEVSALIGRMLAVIPNDDRDPEGSKYVKLNLDSTASQITILSMPKSSRQAGEFREQYLKALSKYKSAFQLCRRALNKIPAEPAIGFAEAIRFNATDVLRELKEPNSA